MPTLEPGLRDLLASVIGKENADTGARLVAEAGAKAAIEALAVHLPSPYGHLDGPQKQLRNRLRAHARQLGDTRHADGRHEAARLIEHAAYEHWHRMLFARFLAENDLLIHPEMKVAVTLEECSALATSEGAADGWELAGRFASHMLPQIFRPDDPLLAVRFAIDDVKKLEGLLESLPSELFRASDSLGWCYQFWQARRKKDINASQVKIGADELPAVTQLFTEPYMVQFLLHNTLGAWWVGAGRPLPVEMPYLRLLDNGMPAAGTFEGWPRLARELKVLDPCCGSGHFLVAAFEVLVAFRIAEEGISAGEACDAVLRDNLFGLEIDARCVQIAAFALAMAAWTYPDAGGYRSLAPMNIACSGLAISAKKDEWERLGGDNPRLRAGMGRMWELFRQAAVLGSLINPKNDPGDPLWAARPDELRPAIARLVEVSLEDPEATERAVSASGISVAAHMLAQDYDLIVTNVPYLGRGDHGAVLISLGDREYPRSKADLATMFIERMRAFGPKGRTVAIVSPQTWWQQPAYSDFRKSLLETSSFHLIAALGEEAWQHFGKRGPRATLTVLTNGRPSEFHEVYGIDAQEPQSITEKDALLRRGAMASVLQAEMLAGPDARIVFASANGSLLSNFADAFQGLKTGDDFRYRRLFWEVRGSPHWKNYQSTPSSVTGRGGLESVVWWKDDGAYAARRQGVAAWGRAGVAVSQMRTLVAKPYNGAVFDSNIAAVVPKNPRDLPAIFAFICDDDYQRRVRVPFPCNQDSRAPGKWV